MAYLAGLGADAVPAILDRLDDLPPTARCDLRRVLWSRWGAHHDARDDGDWRTWNAARAAARRAVRAAEADLRAAAPGC